MRIGFYIAKDNGVTGKLIRGITRSDISHCVLIFGLNLTFSSDPGIGTQFQVITDLYDKERWIVYDLPWISQYDQDKILAFCHQEMNCGYDYKGVILGSLNPLYQDKNKWFCSEICSVAIRPFTKGLTDFWYTPGGLYSELQDIKVFNI